jgi:hypothetical protein
MSRQNRRTVLKLSIAAGSTLALGQLLADEPKKDLFARDNLVAWCIVPFDSQKRGPDERVTVLKELGFKKYAYDWRAEHLPTFDHELDLLKKEGIELTSVWFPAGLNDEAKTILGLLEKHGIKTQLWITMGDPAPGKSDEEKVEAAASAIRPIAEAAGKIGCRVSLYNHGAWFGEPENQLKVIQKIGKDSVAKGNVGIVYNLHHGHDHLERFAKMLDAIIPHLDALNLNGMDVDGERRGRKILALGEGERDLQLLKVIAASKYTGPIGILGHTGDDMRLRLMDNLDGLEWLRPQVAGKEAGPAPKYRTTAGKK